MPIARSKFFDVRQLHHKFLLAKMFYKTLAAGTKAAYLGLNPSLS
jgi:hypothetical protein